MAVDPQFPQVGADLVTDKRKPTTWWYAYWARQNELAVAAQASADAANAAIAAIPPAVLPHITAQLPVKMYGDDENPIVTLDPAFVATIAQRGPPGIDGQDGEPGDRGYPGAKGDKGDRGEIGPPGRDGEDGEPGPPGMMGATGATGATGAAGSGSGQTIIIREEVYEDAWPIPGPKGDTGAAGGGGSGAMTYVGGAVIAGAAATVLTISGLDLNTDVRYFVEYSFKNATASTVQVDLFYNADTTATNYDSQVILASAASASGGRANNGRICDMLTGATGMGWIRILNDRDNCPSAIAESRYAATTNIRYIVSAHMWRTAGTNVTGITLSSSVASAFAIGSYIKVWKIT